MMMFWIWLILAAITAVIVALIQYEYLFGTNNTKRKPWFAVLRAITVFCILLLLISPKFESTSYTTLKPHLILMVDNSYSLKSLGVNEDVVDGYQKLSSDPDITAKFEVLPYQFGETVNNLDSLDFNENATNIAIGVEQPQELFRDRNKAIVLFTDGNQTVGSNYTYSKIDRKTHLYPIVYGDTTHYPDVKITQLNVNRYSYLDNTYPVEIFANYNGNDAVTTNLRVMSGNNTLYQKQLSFDPSSNSQVVTVELESKSVGLQKMVAILEPIDKEKNTTNNRRDFAVEVIDQQSKILILSNTTHPDVAALKNAINSNRQRSVDIFKTTDAFDMNEYNLVVMYGFDSAFAKAYSLTTSLQKNTWLILGPKPDLALLNRTIESFNIENFQQTDDVQPLLNASYSNFNLESFSYEDYPPVQSPFGQIQINAPSSTLMNKQIGAVVTTQPLWFTYENGNSRHGVFAGSGLWRWRAQSYLDSKDFKNFDDLVNSQVQFLSSNKKRNRLDVDFKTFYYENDEILFTAQYLNQNYEFVDDGVLNMVVVNNVTNDRLERPFTRSDYSYSVDLSGLEAGDYDFNISAATEKLTTSGSFSILEFNIEQQFVNSDYQSLSTVATEGLVFTGKEMEELKTKLMSDPLLQEIERSEVSYQSLIDWKILMGLIGILLGLEWFLRKYNGLI